MTDPTKHRAYFGDGEYDFALSFEIIEELQRKTGVGIGELYQRITARLFYISDIVEVIRCGLIGGGTAPIRAQQLVDAYAKNRPFAETLPLALDILDARWAGIPDALMTNAINDALEQVAE
ncbi:gene transfer agent family protein [Rhizobium sp. TRM95796]|uniref:gene transfer agent family protein n=1 Tax=Rhizobium sp. TRM95796 TaxID=2979862 RepID=UPI0021E9A91F|nr:gene transfer agent family protein [Rhizobium sp. TRM95796]MCV3766481.1 gene transfer agent family protein [Rhizobium sp. TRM95796]